jgi:hypothetical protein
MSEKIIAETDRLVDELLSDEVAKVVHTSPEYVKIMIHPNLKKLERKMRQMLEEK